MFSNINPLNKHGRSRLGSSIFIDGKVENIKDTITGSSKQSFVLYSMIIIMFVKFLSANVEGLIYGFILYYILYFSSVVETSLTFTDKRVLSITKYRYPRIIRILGIFLIGWVVVSILKIYNSNLLITSENRFLFMEWLFNTLNILPIFFHQYVLFLENNGRVLLGLDILISVSINLWTAINFRKISYNFSEVNFSQISDQLITQTKRSATNRLIGLHILEIILLIFVFKIMSLFFLIIVLLLHLAIPKTLFSDLNFFGQSGRKILPMLSVEQVDFHKVNRITSELFKLGKYESDGNYPLNLIPNEVASFYETGLQASLSSALNQGNLLGGLVAIIINIFVIVDLFIFALNYNITTLLDVIGITIGLLVGNVAFWFFLKFIGKIQIRFQREEILMIGQGFISRWNQPNLWIIKGDKLEGKRNKKKRRQKLLHYDRSSGITIAWKTILIIFVLGLSSTIVLFWISVGALNISRIVFIFPFLFNLGLNFLTIKANAELSFFMVSSFVLWVVIYYLYPRFYANSRPQLVFDLEHLSTLSVILKDQEDHLDAINQFAKCIIFSSRSERRGTNGRPGYFNLEIYLVGYVNESDSSNIMIEFGENRRKSKIIDISNSFEKSELLMDNLLISAESGFPQFTMKINDYISDQNQKVILDEFLILDKMRQYTFNLTTQNKLVISLEIKLKSSHN